MVQRSLQQEVLRIGLQYAIVRRKAATRADMQELDNLLNQAVNAFSKETTDRYNEWPNLQAGIRQ